MKLRKSGGLILSFLFLINGLLLAQEKTTKDIPKNRETIKHIEQIVGTWKLQQITDGQQKKNKKDPNEQDESSNAFQMFEFRPDGRYKSNNGTEAVDSGSYRLNEVQGILYLESDMDESQSPSEWTLTFKGQTMTIAGRGAKEDAKRFRYTYVKTKAGLGTNQ
jgi:hypothetical protein